MVGVGRTVFAGTELEDFKVHVLGVMRNVIGPKRSLILARLEGGPLAKTGVIAGMSGSPVYVDGRLMGAVSYALGQFSTEPIAGITPIAEMLDATMMSAPARSTRPVSLSWPATPRELLDIWAAISAARVRSSTIRRRRWSCRAASADLTRVSAMLRPIAVPMIASGFDASVIDPFVAVALPRPASCRCRAHSRPAPAITAAERSSASARRCGGRGPADRRLRARRHRNRDARRRRSGLCVRPSALQPGPDAVPDDARRRAGGAARA